MTISQGDRLPNVDLVRATEEGPQPVTADALFKGRTVALFAVPGAFTPACSARHLPGFRDLHDELKGQGMDAVICLSVNDAFVMKAWAENQEVEGRIEMIADGCGLFTRAVGMEFDASGFGLGMRSRRYSMVVEDGVVTKLNVEKSGEFEVSDAGYMLRQLKGDAD